MYNATTHRFHIPQSRQQQKNNKLTNSEMKLFLFDFQLSAEFRLFRFGRSFLLSRTVNWILFYVISSSTKECGVKNLFNIRAGECNVHSNSNNGTTMAQNHLTKSNNHAVKWFFPLSSSQSSPWPKAITLIQQWRHSEKEFISSNVLNYFNLLLFSKGANVFTTSFKRFSLFCYRSPFDAMESRESFFCQ